MNMSFGVRKIEFKSSFTVQVNPSFLCWQIGKKAYWNLKGMNENEQEGRSFIIGVTFRCRDLWMCFKHNRLQQWFYSCVAYLWTFRFLLVVAAISRHIEIWRGRRHQLLFLFFADECRLWISTFQMFHQQRNQHVNCWSIFEYAALRAVSWLMSFSSYSFVVRCLL
jgi:hypothetical protein